MIFEDRPRCVIARTDEEIWMVREPATSGRSTRQSRIAPLYHQVYIQLRQRLIEGGLDPRVPLPSEPSLASDYGVSRVTIRKTLERLQGEGLIRRVHGIGTFPVAVSDPADKTNIAGLLENLISYEASTTATNLYWETTVPEPPLAHSLGEAPCLRIVRLRSYLGQPISLTTLHVPQLYAGLLDPALPGDEPVIRQLDRQGVIAEQAEQVITAVAADAEASRHLGISEQAPLIAMRRLMLDGDRRPGLHQESFYTPERFEYRMTLTRMSVGPAARWTRSREARGSTSPAAASTASPRMISMPWSCLKPACRRWRRSPNGLGSAVRRSCPACYVSPGAPQRNLIARC